MTQTKPLATDSMVIAAEGIAELPWVPNDWGGLARVLWQDRCSSSVAGVLALGPSESHNRHTHTDVTHHVWILSGSLRIGDDVYGRGSYACIPAGTAHGPERAGPEGCELFYVLVPAASPQQSSPDER